MVRLRIGIAALVVLLIAGAASAQTFTVGGRASDAQGGIIANAEVTLRLLPPPGMAPRMPGMATTPDLTTRTAANGTYTFNQVPAGVYVLTIDAPGFERSSQEVTVNAAQTVNGTLSRLEISGADAAATPAAGAGAAAPAAPGAAETQALVDRIKTLEQRVIDLESSTVLSDPVTRVKRIEVWVDKNGNEYDHEVPGSVKKVTYQRERVYRRENINEKIEEAIADAEQRNVKVGVSAATVAQLSGRTRGDAATTASGAAYALASADLFFTAGIAQHTVFFADIVGLSGSPPDAEIPSLSLLNSYTARLVSQNELNLREAWVRTEVFSQRLAIVAGRLDLTNYFDHNAAANDETTQFISDALVNNPALGLAVNGAGAAAIFDPKAGLNFKVGIQQSTADAKNLSESIFSLFEGGYVARPPGLGEGNYRLWYRWNNSQEAVSSPGAFGLSIDQKIVPTITLFGRYGSAKAATGRDDSYSIGGQIQNGWVFNPLDTWGVGYSQIDNADGLHEKLLETYYNFRLTDRLRLSFHFQGVLDRSGDTSEFAYVLPGVRLQASF